MSAKVSIIIPCYNAALFIEETLRSIVLQSYRDYEVVIIDDGSTDTTKEIISRLKEPKVNYIFQENKGVSAARNKGLEFSAGEYVLFLDADDLLDPDFLKHRVETLENNPDILFTCSVARLIDETGNSLKMQYQPVCENVEEEICTYKSGYCSCPSNYLLRKEFKEKGIRFEERLSNSADRFFLLQINKIGKGKKVTGNSRLNYRIHSKSMSKVIHPKNILDLMLFYKLVLKNKLVPNTYYLKLKLKTFRISFSEALLIKKFPLAFKVITSVLLEC